MPTKGKLFESFVEHVLVSVGFFAVPVNGKEIYNGPAGKMLHGLGNPHNADVLVEPPFQTPVYWPTRLLVECKDKQKSTGLSEVRNVLGVREDINHFDMVDFDLMKIRSRRHNKPAISNFERYQYQVAIASVSGFTVTAQEFAYTHRIHLITFKGFPLIKNLLVSIEKIKKTLCNQLYSFNDVLSWTVDNSTGLSIKQYADNISIAVTSNGILIFLYNDPNIIVQSRWNEEGEFTLHFFKENKNVWYLHYHEMNYRFILPEVYQEYWKRSFEENKAFKPSNIKKSFFQSLLFMTQNDKPKIITLSEGFIKETIESESRHYQ